MAQIIPTTRSQAAVGVAGVTSGLRRQAWLIEVRGLANRFFWHSSLVVYRSLGATCLPMHKRIHHALGRAHKSLGTQQGLHPKIEGFRHCDRTLILSPELATVTAHRAEVASKERRVTSWPTSSGRELSPSSNAD